MAGCSGETETRVQRDGTIATGRAAFAPCAVCHAALANAGPRIGPSLWKIVGRTAGTGDSFAYSRAMRAAGDTGLVWTRENLDLYLTDPTAFIANNRMSFAGIEDEQTRAAVIDYLETLAPPTD